MDRGAASQTYTLVRKTSNGAAFVAIEQVG
jgi:hypothetical protein